MRLITADQIHQRCSFPELIDALDRFHQETPAELKDMLMSPSAVAEEAGERFFIRAAWNESSAIGVKATTIFPKNTAAAGLPSIHAVYLLFEGQRGTPSAIIDGTALTYYKTAADSALGAKHLARQDVESMAMIGAGAMAPYLIQAHCCVRESIRTVAIWNRTFAKAQKIARELSIPDVTIVAEPCIETAVSNADLVCSATMTLDPVISGEWIRPGAHVDLVGAYTPAMREVDDSAIRRSRIFVDSRKTTITEIGEIAIPIRAGIIAETDILADLYDLCARRAQGRESAEEITLFKNGGGGHLDLMTAQHIESVTRLA